MKRFAIILLFFIFAGTIRSQVTWEKLNPTTADFLQKVYMLNDTVAVAVGSAGTIIRSTNCGDTWSRVECPVDEDLWDIYFTNEETGWIVSDTHILFSGDRGITWTIQRTTTASLTTIYFINNFVGFAGGSFGTILKTMDGGTTWRSVGVSTTYSWIFDIHFPSPDYGYAVGSNDGFFTTTNGGESWSFSENPDGYGSIWKSVYFTTESDGFKVGMDTKHTSNFGSTWNEVPGLTPDDLNNQILHQIGFVPGGFLYVIGNKGTFAQSFSGGAGWQVFTIPNADNLYGIHFVDPVVGIAVGNGGEIFNTSDGGINWVKRSSSAMTANLTNLFFIDSLNGWVIGDSGFYAHTMDGGHSWKNFQNPSKLRLEGIYFIDANNGWISGDGGLVMWTNNGGITWQDSHTPGGLYLADVKFMDPLNGIAVGVIAYGDIFLSVDGGLTWMDISNRSLPPLYCAAVRQPHEFFIGGDSGFMSVSPDTGQTWIDIPLPTGLPIRKIQFVNSVIGFALTEKDLLVTKDGGTTWNIVPSVPGGMMFTSMHFVSDQIGWIVGDKGKIYRTENGGATWIAEPQKTNLTLNAIDFSDPHNGWAVGANGVILGVHSGLTVDVKKVKNEIPQDFSLEQNYPNPFGTFNGKSTPTTIRFSLPEKFSSQKVSLKIYDSIGREIATLVNSHKSAGLYEVNFVASNLPSGIYFYTLKTGDSQITKKMVLLK